MNVKLPRYLLTFINRNQSELALQPDTRFDPTQTRNLNLKANASSLPANVDISTVFYAEFCVAAKNIPQS